VIDYFTHPTHFGNHYTEAVTTGLGAALISILVSFILDKKNQPTA